MDQTLPGSPALKNSTGRDGTDSWAATLSIIGVFALSIVNAVLGAGIVLALSVSALTLVVVASTLALRSPLIDRMVNGVIVDHERRLSSKQSGGLKEMFYEVVEFDDGGERFRFVSRVGSRRRSMTGSRVGVRFVSEPRPRALIMRGEEPWNPAMIGVPGALAIAALAFIAGWFSIVPVAAAVLAVWRFRADVPAWMSADVEHVVENQGVVPTEQASPTDSRV